jgi:hypothetical protein
MSDRQGDAGSSPASLTYFYDFILILEKRYAWASVAGVFEEIAYARMVGWAIAGLTKRQDGVFILRTPIGRGDYAYVELELDSSGILQPVMGGFIEG